MTKDVKDINGVEIIPFVKPIRMNLQNVSKKDAYDEQMLIMGINESIEDPKKDAEGFKVWNEMLDFRGKLPMLMCEAVNEISKLSADSAAADTVEFDVIPPEVKENIVSIIRLSKNNIKNFSNVRVAKCNVVGKISGSWTDAHAALIDEEEEIATAFYLLRKKYGYRL